MIDRTTFYQRLPVCKACEFWRGACLKGHVLQGTLGCPLKKFEGIQGVGYMDDLPVPTPELPAISANGCCGPVPEGELKPMSWGEVWRHLMAAMEDWKKAGFPVVPGEAYVERVNVCKSCPKGQYQWFQCKHCRCVIYTKAKLATEDCPFGLWPKRAAVVIEG
jgi:hypothetical protein